MNGLDTNVLLAWLLKGQARALPGKPPYRISLIVLAELAWVLRSTFNRKRAEIADVVDAMLAAPGLTLANRPAVEAAVQDYRKGPADLADYLIMRDNAEKGGVTYTLDRKAAKHPGFELIS